MGIIVRAENNGTAFTEVNSRSSTAALSTPLVLDASYLFIHQHFNSGRLLLV